VGRRIAFHLRNVPLFLALIGIRGSVKTPTFAQTVVSMANVVSVGVDTERKTTRNARLHSKPEQEKEQLMTAERARAAEEGPKSLEPRGEKRKAEDILIPKFRRGFVWGDSSSKNISLAALYIKTAPPLPRPSEHLVRVNNPCEAYVKVSGH